MLWPERSHRIINGCRQDLGGGKQTFATLVACRIHQRPAVVQQRVAGHGGPGRPAVAGDGLLGRLARLLGGSRGSVKVSSKVGHLWIWLPGRGLVVRLGVEGAGGAKLERDVVGGVCGVRGRDVVGVVVFGAARRVHGARRCEKDSEMPIAACRWTGRRGTKIERIYISQRFPFPVLESLPSSHGQTQDRNPTHHGSFPCFLALPRPHPLPSTSATDPSPSSRCAPPLSLSPPRLPPFQRKNGLFKKAYELGVLCSVDVAVIVFDNKQGGSRLYQYGSDDVVAIVDRAMRVRAAPPLSRDAR